MYPSMSFQIMCQAIKLYADNLLCMDVCGFPSEDAMTLLGAEVRVRGLQPLSVYLYIVPSIPSTRNANCVCVPSNETIFIFY